MRGTIPPRRFWPPPVEYVVLAVTIVITCGVMVALGMGAIG